MKQLGKSILFRHFKCSIEFFKIKLRGIPKSNINSIGAIKDGYNINGIDIGFLF